MRVISKKIVYNNLTSKLPGVVPSIMDSWTIPSLYTNCGEKKDIETYYSYNNAVKRASEYNIRESQLKYEAQFVNFDKNNLIEFTVGNYGLIPSDVIIPEGIANTITDYTDIYVNIPDNNGGFYDLSWPKNDSDPHYEGREIISGGTKIKILTYYTLNKWYTFFKTYYDLINNPGYQRVYDNAMDYYNEEIDVKNEEQEAYYKSLDDTFLSRGGKTMYDWISNNCIIQYQIPDKFTNGWNTTYLYYPDALKWYYWFKKRVEDYKYVVNYEDCNLTGLGNGNCCDCTEYVRLGGYEFFSDLENWINGININSNFATNSASITIPISITTSIDDLGEMSIFSNKWIEEADYHNTLSNVSGGTVMNSPHIKYCKCKNCGYEEDEKHYSSSGYVCPNCGCDQYIVFDATINEEYMIKGGETHIGYEYNEYYENIFKTDDWVNYTDYYINLNPEKFISKNGDSEQITSYTFSPINGKIIYNPTSIEKNINIIKIPDVCINGNTYDVINGKYVELCYSTYYIADLKYRKQTKLPVYKDGDIEYVVINGKRKYVEADPNNPDIEKVYFLKEYNCHDDGCVVKSGEYIIYDSCLYLVNNRTITISEGETQIVYPVLDGYFDIDDNRFYVSGNSVVIQDTAEYNEENNIYTYTFRKLNDSELRELNIEKIVVSGDKTYVTLFYIFEAHNSKVISGYTNSKLNILRRKEVTTDDLGNELPGYFKSIVDITKGSGQSKYNVPYDECVLDILYKVGEVSNLRQIGVNKNKFIGNIIKDIKFYYADEFRNPIIDANNHQILAKSANEDNALEAIEQCETEYYNYISEHKDATIPNIMFCDITYYMGAVINKNNDKYSIDIQYHKGVKYIDTVYVTKKVGTYYLNDDRQFTFNYYLLTQDINSIIITDFNYNTVVDASTYFEMNIFLYDAEEKEFDGFEKNNGVIAAPLFRNEFNLASSLPQNVEADIYIDRGINAAFEKLLKLQEFRTMEALENYGNGWFKINKY